MITSLSFFERLSQQTTQENDSLRVMMFPVLDYFFALPIGAVYKVITCPSFTTGNDGIGNVEWGLQSITIVDLRYKIWEVAEQKSNTLDDEQREKNDRNPKFLMMFQTQAGELCGIPVHKAPVLMDIALEHLHPLPLSQKQVNKLDFVEHMAVIPQAENHGAIKIFCLGTREILASKLGWNQKNEVQSRAETPITATNLSNCQQSWLLLALTQVTKALVPLNSVQQVVQFSPSKVSPAPAEPDWLIGLYDWQGQSLRVADLNQLLGFESLLQCDRQQNSLQIVVLRLQNQLFGVLVTDVLQIESHSIASLQENLSGSEKVNKFVKGIIGNEHWLIDTDALVEAFKGYTY